MTKCASGGVRVSISVFQWRSTLRRLIPLPARSALAGCRAGLRSAAASLAGNACRRRFAAATCAPESLTKPSWKSSEGAFARKRRSNNGASARSPACQTTSVPLRWKNTGSGISAIKPGQRLKRRRPELSDQQFRAGGLGERRKHCRRDPRGRLRSGGVAALVQRHTMPRTRQQPRDQPPAQAATDDGEVVSAGRSGMSGMHNGVHDDDASSADAAERTEHSTEIEIGRNARFEPWLHARRTKHVPRDETAARRAAGSALTCGSWASQYWKKLETRWFPETSLAGITRIGCKGTLSASPRVLRSFKEQTRAETPLFRHRSLKHKSETTRKRGDPRGDRSGRRDPALGMGPRGQTGRPSFRSWCAHSGTMPRTPGSSAAHAYASACRCCMAIVVSRARIKEQLSHARNNAPARAVFNGLDQ